MSQPEKHKRYEDLSDLLAVRAPDLRESIEAVRQWWAPEIPGQHVVYGDIFNPYLTELVEAGTNDKALTEAFALLEDLAKSSDVHVQEVAGYTVLEHLLSSEALLAKARPFMGPATLALLADVEEFWRRLRAARHEEPP